MMAPEDTEDLISEIQTSAPGSLLSVWFNHFLFSCFALSVLVIVVVPKVDQINQRLGPLAQEFNKLVYPANYNPESKPAAKRKSGQGCEVYLARVLLNLH